MSTFSNSDIVSYLFPRFSRLQSIFCAFKCVSVIDLPFVFNFDSRWVFHLLTDGPEATFLCRQSEFGPVQPVSI